MVAYFFHTRNDCIVICYCLFSLALYAVGHTTSLNHIIGFGLYYERMLGYLLYAVHIYIGYAICLFCREESTHFRHIVEQY